ncbi:MAG: S8 family serine peptidase [Xanthomonadales bacterium]|nr:S8 family serine peptidase [Xanthomonadales bacterium]
MKGYYLKTIILIAAITGVLLGNAVIAAGPDSDRYIISFQNAAKGKSALRAAGADVLLDLPNQRAVAARIPARALKGLQRNPNIEYIEVDAPRFPMSQTTPWGIPTVQADLLSDAATGNTLVCIIDSGYSNGHEDLPLLDQGDTSPNSGTGDPLASSTLCHHGTHVAGTIAASANNVGVVGVNPNGNVGLHIVKVFEDDANSPSGCGWGYSSSLIAALDACIAAGSGTGAKTIINMSLGGPTKNRTEQRAFSRAYDAGVLSIAAAGNDGNTRHSYPASYDSVISVAAVDSALVVADFSQQTSQVELAAPGVAVRSTVTMNTGTEESLDVGGSGYEATGMEGSAQTSASGALFRCNAIDGFGSPGDCAGASGKICLISRGDTSFAEKAIECEGAGGVGVVIFNNTTALFSGTFGDSIVSIPGVGISGTDGAVLGGKLGQSATITNTAGHYAYYDGTSMATPHVAGVAALVWSHDLSCTNADIRNALASTAFDLGTAGRDNAYGYGLVQAEDAVLGLDCGGGGGGGQCDLLPQGAACSDGAQCCSGNCKGKRGAKTCK